MKRTTLLVTYEYPPSGGGGVQRVAKFARYLPEFGWQPAVVTSAPAKGRPLDVSLLEEVLDVPVVRLPPRRVSGYVAAAVKPARRARARLERARGHAAGGAPPGEALRPAAPSVSARIARHVSIDDAAWWAVSAARAGVQFGRRQGVKAVVATGPPFSVTIAGSRIARELGVPLIVDMRDGWRDNPTAWHANRRWRRRALDAERAVMTTARVVLATTGVIAAEAKEMGGGDVRLLPNGYDAADVVPWAPRSKGALRLAFMGRMYRNHSEPWDLLGALAQLRVARPELDVVFEIIGEEWSAVRERAAALGLSDTVVFAGYLPHHEAVCRVAAADVAVAIVVDRPGARATALGKLYEYIGVGIPVLAIVPPDGESAKLVEANAAGWVLAPGDVEGIAARLTTLAEQKREGLPARGAPPEFAARYVRRALTGRLAAVLDEVTHS
jgi:glycosyltransferase involved in cell wall biosynthesis